MSGISDELRKHAKRMRNLRIFTYKDPSEYEHLADRIDAEMVELPRDRDGAPIHVGDTVWNANKDAIECTVTSIELYEDITKIFTSCRGTEAIVSPTGLTHNRPDSWERIADDVETLVWLDDEDEERLRKELAERIRRLAKEGGHE